MEGTCKWITGAVIGLVGILGLFFSAHAHDNTMYALGLAVFAVAVGVLFCMIKRQFDLHEGASH